MRTLLCSCKANASLQFFTPIASTVSTMNQHPYCLAAVNHPIHSPYHEQEYGFPQSDEAVLFERLILEINQAGLSWLTILKKRSAFAQAYANFSVDLVAQFNDADRSRLLHDAGIIRNRLKVNAAIINAQRVLALRESHGGFQAWLQAHHPLNRAQWVRLFKKQFLFTGGEITGEFLLSLGYLPGAHGDDCPIYPRVIKANPPWLKVVTAQPNFYRETP
jgi:DNA-3-methyladenine glycosylase I